MRIPNKFNGYSADNRRIYNDPTMIVATIANMGEGAAAAAAIAEAAAAATAAETAAAAATEQAATQAAAQQAGQAGIMQGASVPPPGVTPPGAPGLGAPVAPATPLPPAEPLPPVEPAGINPITPAGEYNPAFAEELGKQNAERLASEGFREAAPGQAQQLTADVSNTIAPEISSAPSGMPSAEGSPFTPRFGPEPPIVGPQPGLQPPPPAPPKPPLFGDNALGRGIDQAMKLVSDTAGEAYEGYRKAPAALQYLSAGAAAKQFLMDKPEGAPKDKYKPTPYSGLSPNFTPGGPSPYLYGANGGLMSAYADGGPVEQMSNMNAGVMPTTGQNNMYPMSQQKPLAYANPAIQNPISQNVLDVGATNRLDPYTGMPAFSEGGYAEDKKKKEDAEQRKYYSQLMSGKSGSDLENDIAQGQAIAARAKGSSVGIIPRSRTQSLSSPNTAAQTEMAAMFKNKGIKAYLPKMLDPQSASAGAGETEFAANGGAMYSLGQYSDGGRLLRGPGDGVSDSIPAQIGAKQPARLADGEFVIPARIVSELGNGSTEAGARKLYAMMERVQNGRKKSVGKGKVAVDSKATKHLPA